MIITDKFVFIHLPKTGGSFVTSVLRKIHNRRGHERIWDRLYNRWAGGGEEVNYQERSKHAQCFAIPKEHRDKTICSVIRHPFDLYVSRYFFGWWRTRSENYCHVEKVKSQYPHFPDLSFEEFLCVSADEFGKLFNPLTPKEDGIGWYGRDVIKFFFKDPWHDFYNIDKTYISRGAWKGDMFDVRLLRTSNLNQDLYEFLSDMGYRQEDLQFVLEKGKERPDDQVKSREGRTVEDMFTSEAKEFVRHRDRLVFEMFPEFKDEYAESSQAC